MKTSNKLLIAFLIFFPVTILIYNFLLKGEFVKGNIKPNGSGHVAKDNNHALKPFRHIVYDGALWSTSINGDRRTYGERHKLTVFMNNDTTPFLAVSPVLDKYLQIEQRDDTLFVSHQITRQVEGKYYNDYSLRIYAQELSSISGTRCDLRIFTTTRKNTPLKLHLNEYATCAMEAVSLPSLDLLLDANAKCGLNYGGRIDTLAYQLAKDAYLEIHKKVQIAALQPGKTDITANISFTGSATDMVQLLQTAKQ